jgi:glycerophosphoryl diester phosphodiesterase
VTADGSGRIYSRMQRKGNGLLFQILKVVLIVLAVLTMLYLFMIMPRMLHRPDRTAFRCRLFAHRGLYDNKTEAPENSLPAFRKAVDAGYGIELDVQMTADHVPVVFHDFTLQRVCGVSGKVRDYTLAELQKMHLCGSSETIPTFEEVLRLVGGRVPLIVELKMEFRDFSVCRSADELLRTYPGIYCIESFNPLALLWYRRKHPDIMRGQLSDGFIHYSEFQNRRAPGMFFLQMMLGNFATKPDFVSYNHRYMGNLSRVLCRVLFRCKSAAWTIRSEAQLKHAWKHFDVFIFDSFIPEEKNTLPENENAA